MNTMNLSVPPKPESLLEVTVCANGSGNSEHKDIAKDRKAGAESVVMPGAGDRDPHRGCEGGVMQPGQSKMQT